MHGHLSDHDSSIWKGFYVKINTLQGLLRILLSALSTFNPILSLGVILHHVLNLISINHYI